MNSKRVESLQSNQCDNKRKKTETELTTYTQRFISHKQKKTDPTATTTKN
jgi:hypothetical protein